MTTIKALALNSISLEALISLCEQFHLSLIIENGVITGIDPDTITDATYYPLT